MAHPGRENPMQRIRPPGPWNSPVLLIAAVAALQVLTFALLIARDVAAEASLTCRAGVGDRTEAPRAAVLAFDGRAGAI
jgi:hypothetical protein